MRLFIGNKNYSSWSLRPWLLMRVKDIAFEEVYVRFGDMSPESAFKRTMNAVTPVGRVPVLVDDDGFAIWDSLAIVETLAERFPQLNLWPAPPPARARARSVCAEMHGGLSAMRQHFSMNLELSMPEIGAQVLREHEAARADLARVVAMWSELLTQHGGPFLFGRDFTIPDAYFAPVCARIRSYGLPVPPAIATYVAHIFSLPAMQAWVTAGLAEHDFVDVDEPYRKRPA